MISNETVTQATTDLGNDQLITVELLTDDQVQSQVNGTVELIRENMHIQVISALRYLQAVTRSNGFVSALNTDSVIRANYYSGVYDVSPLRQTLNTHMELESCNVGDYIFPAGFFFGSYESGAQPYVNNSIGDAYAAVSGFFGGCRPLDALLGGTLDCLYDDQCLEPFQYFFPALNQVCMAQLYLSCKLFLYR